MEENSNFFTPKGYQCNSLKELTPTMEDYLEMIFRLLNDKNVVRISELAHHLNVKPSSTSKIAQSLKELGYVDYEKYGYLTLTPKGIEYGQYLFYRHSVLQDFLCFINGTQDELEQVENIEHYLDTRTIENIKRLTDQLKSKK